MPSAGTTSVSTGLPSVRVPVLSKAIAFTDPSASSGPPPFTRMPRRAERAIAASTALGVAIASAHGLAATSTAMARANDTAKSSPSSGGTMRSPTTRASTAGTNTRTMRFVRRWVGEICVSASATICTTRESVESAATLRTITSIAPLPFSVPANTRCSGGIASIPSSPSEGSAMADLSTGTLSPVTADSSMAVTPATMTPSAGMRSFGRTIRMSLTRSSPTGTSMVGSSRRRAVAGARSLSASIAFRARSIA